MAPHRNITATPNLKQPQFVTKQMKPIARPKLVVKKLLNHILRICKFHHFGACNFSNICQQLLAYTGWFLKETKRDTKHVDYNCDELYRKFMSNPKLHSHHGINDINRFIYLEDGVRTARYYASFMWNWNLHNKAKQCNKILEFIRRSLYLTIKYMNEEDLNTIHTLLMNNHAHVFSRIKEVMQVQCFKSYLEGQIYYNMSSLSALIEVIHHWFLVMPILLELSKITGWTYIYDCKACLLGLDTLYTVFLNIAYKTPQATDLPDTQ